MSKLKKFLIILGVIWLAIIIYFAGYLIGHKNFVFEQNYQPKLVNRELKKPESVDFGIFWNAWDIITEKYVGSYSVQKLVYGAINGMVDSLGDPYSSLIEEGDNKMFLEDLSGEIEGIGAEISMEDGQLIVISPLKGSPAQKQGLKPHDEILAIDNQDTSILTLDEAVKLIRGKAGTQVKLLINREGFSETQEFTITREKIVISSVQWEMMGDIGYIQVSQFGDDTKDLINQAADELSKNNPKAIILDLRNNPGGYLETSVDVAGIFLSSDQVVVKEQYKDGHKDELKTEKDGKLKDYQVIVLINEGSASAAEIVAGALQDLRGATLVGKKTFGKGSVQELENLDPETILKITIAKWLTPNDRTIDKEGIEPNIEVELSQEDEDAGRDPQLDKALEAAR